MIQTNIETEVERDKLPPKGGDTYSQNTCTEIESDKVWSESQRKASINSSEKKIYLVDLEKQIEEKIESIYDQQKEELKKMETQHHKRILAYQESLDEKVAEANSLQEKIAAMVQIVSTYHGKTSSEVKEYVLQAEESRQKEAETREELHEALKQIQDHEELNSMLENECYDMKNDLTEKEMELSVALEEVSKLSESPRNQSAVKAKEHQYMREKKKWVTTEKNLRQELKEALQKCEDFKAQYEIAFRERKELTDLSEEMEEENETLRTEIKSLGKESDKFKLGTYEDLRFSLSHENILETREEFSSSSSERSKDALEYQRIENDAIRKYMRKRRTAR